MTDGRKDTGGIYLLIMVVGAAIVIGGLVAFGEAYLNDGWVVVLLVAAYFAVLLYRLFRKGCDWLKFLYLCM